MEWRRANRWMAAIVWLGMGAAAAGCQSEERAGTSGPQKCTVDVPCEDDPNKTCTVPCKENVGAGVGVGSGTAGGGVGGSGGGGVGGGSVDATGNVMQLTTAAFDELTLYTDPITVIAPGAFTSTVEAETKNGEFSLVDAASGFRWILAKDGDGGVGGAFSTYSLQFVSASPPLVLPVVPVDVLDGIATQMGVASLAPGQAHLVLSIVDQAGNALDGVEVLALSGATVGYDVAPGEYASNVGTTGTLGIAVMLNANTAGQGTVKVQMTYLDEPFETTIAIAVDTVTFAGVRLFTGP